MKAKIFIWAAVAVALAASCQKTNELEPGDGKTYNFGLAVINKDYTEEVAFTNVGATTIKSVENLPAWVKGVTLRETGYNGDPVALVEIKGDINLDEPRQAKVVVTMGSGAIVNLELTQWPTLRDGDNAVYKSKNTAFEKDWAGTKKIKLITGNKMVNGSAQIDELEVSLPWDFDHNPLNYLPRGAGGETAEVYKMLENKEDWSLVFNLTGITNSPNLNYFGLYNRYSGILRIFYYFTDEMIPQNTSDHLWSFAASYDVSEHVSTQFALPREEEADFTFRQMAARQVVTSPNTDDYNLLKEQKCVPKVGWWAFDVSMTALRKNAFFNQLNQNSSFDIRLYTYDQSNVLFKSAIQGVLNGTLSGKMNLDTLAPTTIAEWGQVVLPMVNAAGSFLTHNYWLQHVVPNIGTGGGKTKTEPQKDIILNKDDDLLALAPAPRSVVGGAVASLIIGTLINMGGKYLESAAKEKVQDKNLGALNANLFMNLNAVMTTTGTISGPSTNLVPSASMTKDYIKAKNPDGTDTFLGDGVWNLDHHPVVYVVNDAYWSENNFSTFGYDPGAYRHTSTMGQSDIRAYDMGGTKGSRPGLRLITFLDPTSVTGVSFNEKLYDQGLTQLKVYLSYGVYPGAEPGYTDAFRKAAGLSYENTWHIIQKDSINSTNENHIKLFKKPHTDDLFKWTDITPEFREISGYRLSSQQLRTDKPALERRYFGPSMYFDNPYATDFDVDKVEYVYDPQIYVPFDDAGHKLYDPVVPDIVVTSSIIAYGKDSKDAEGSAITSTLRFLPKIVLISYKDVETIYTQIENRMNSGMKGPKNCDETVWADMKTQVSHIQAIKDIVTPAKPK